MVDVRVAQVEKAVAARGVKDFSRFRVVAGGEGVVVDFVDVCYWDVGGEWGEGGGCF